MREMDDVAMPDAPIKQEDDAAKRALRRKRHDLEVEQQRCWEIRRDLADISAKVELLTQEVSVVQNMPLYTFSFSGCLVLVKGMMLVFALDRWLERGMHACPSRICPRSCQLQTRSE